MGEFDDLIEEFVTESREHIADIEEDLIRIEADMEHVDPDVINRVFRAAHSIKGSAKFLDLINIGDLAHRMEDVLNLIRSGKLIPSSEVASPLLRAADMLKGMFEDVESSNGMDISQHLDDLQVILECKDKPAPRATAAAPASPANMLASFSIGIKALRAKMRSGQVFMVTVDPAKLQELEALGEIIETVPLSDSRMNVLFGTIMEPDMVQMALTAASGDVTQVTEQMISATAAGTSSPGVSSPGASSPETSTSAASAQEAPACEASAPAAAHKDNPPQKTAPVEVQNTSFITFALEDEIYAVPIQMIEEIIGRQEISLLPNAPSFIKGVINLRGELVPILDLRTKFGLEVIEEGPLTVYLIVRVGPRVIGMVVDAVSDVLMLNPDQIQKTPAFAAHMSTDSIQGVYKDTQGQMVILIDIAALIRPEEWGLNL